MIRVYQNHWFPLIRPAINPFHTKKQAEGKVKCARYLRLLGWWWLVRQVPPVALGDREGYIIIRLKKTDVDDDGDDDDDPIFLKGGWNF